jgi:hypothetical protein
MAIKIMEEVFKDNDVCVRCLEPISNPVCVHCYMKEIVAWMEDKEIESLAKSIIFTTIERRIEAEAENSTKCVLCKKEKITLCSYCFFLIVARTLNELNFPQDKVEDFLFSFNYRLTHSDYEF